MAFALTTKELTSELRLSAQTLRRLRNEGALRPGIHFRAVGQGTKRPPLLWNIDAVDQALATRSKKELRP
jgi:hypothetical protein